MEFDHVAHSSVGALGWVGGASIFASLFLTIRRKETTP